MGRQLVTFSVGLQFTGPCFDSTDRPANAQRDLAHAGKEIKMKPELTDVSFITGFTYELVTKYGFRALGAPILPSLRSEAIYEAEPNAQAVLVCLQYRLSERIRGAAASLKPVWGVPYYRFQLQPRTRNTRHDLLRSLEDLNVLVFYVAPAFHTRQELYGALTSRTLVNRCAFWSPRQIDGLTLSASNTLAFKPGMDFAILEPGQRRISHAADEEGFLSMIQDRFRANRSETYTDERLAKLGDQMSEAYLKMFGRRKERKLVRDVQESRDRIDARDYVSLICTLLYDCHSYVAVQA